MQTPDQWPADEQEGENQEHGGVFASHGASLPG